MVNERLAALSRPAAWNRSLAAPTLIGLVGSVAIVVGGSAAALPVGDPRLGGALPWDERSGPAHDIAVGLTYAGLVLVAVGWLVLGRRTVRRALAARDVVLATVVWSLPMLVAPPLFTRDPYSYLAYGAMSLHGVDPYATGPSVLGGAFAENVHPFWAHTPAVYGPAFIALSRAVVWLTGDDVMAGVVVLRLAIVLAGMVPLVLALWRLPRHVGGDAATALWVAAANPVTVVLLIGGAHNDLVVIGLMALGFLHVLERRHVVGVALVTVAASVKIVAVLGAVFLLVMWADHLEGTKPARLARAALGVLLTMGAVFIGCTLLGSVGLGWVRSLDAPARIITWLSLPTAVGLAVGAVLPSAGDPLFVCRAVAVLAFLVIMVVNIVAALARPRAAIARAGSTLLAVALLAPGTLPWYYAWGGALLAPTAWRGRGLVVLTFASLALFVGAYPDGQLAVWSPWYVGAVLVSALVGAFVVSRPAGRSGAGTAGPVERRR